MAIEFYTITLLVILCLLLGYFLGGARSSWKNGSAKIHRIKKVQEENKERLIKARKEMRDGQKLRIKAALTCGLCITLLLILLTIIQIQINML